MRCNVRKLVGEDASITGYDIPKGWGLLDQGKHVIAKTSKIGTLFNPPIPHLNAEYCNPARRALIGSCEPRECVHMLKPPILSYIQSQRQS